MKNFKNMKNASIKLLLLFGAVTLIYSCTKKEDEKVAANIIGNWFLTEESEKSYLNDSLIQSESQDTVYTNTDQEVLNISSSNVIITRKESNNGTVVYVKDTVNTKIFSTYIEVYRTYKDSANNTVIDTLKANYTLTEPNLEFKNEDMFTQGNNTYKYVAISKYKRK